MPVPSAASPAGRSMHGGCAKSSGVPRLPLLSWPELRGLARDGWEVGSHGLRHAALPQLADQAMADEVEESKRLLEDRLGLPVTAFAYPYGLVSPRARELVGRSYRSACGDQLGFARAASDRLRLPRIDAYCLRNPVLFGLLHTPLGRAYVALRALGRRLRRLAG